METEKLKEARKPLGIYLDHVDGATDNFGESDESWYEPRLFNAEIGDCSQEPYCACLMGIKRRRKPKNYDGTRGDFICPNGCKGKTVDYSLAADKYTLEEKLTSVQTLLNKKSNLDRKERKDLEENLNTLKEYQKICHDKYDCFTPELKDKYETHWVDLVRHLKEAAITGISTKYPRIAKELKEYFDSVRGKNL